MITTVMLDNRRVTLSSAPLAMGGEAKVYDLGDGRALKIFLTPDDPAFTGSPAEARHRIAEHQVKLRRFPLQGLPAQILQPTSLALHPTTGQIVGYAMPLLDGAEPLMRYSDPLYRAKGIGPDIMTGIFIKLHQLVAGIHQAGVVIGDFNDRNVLVSKARPPDVGEPYGIDVDSMQFGAFPCTEFQMRFVDPLLCDPAAAAPMLARPLTADSDWYAYATMLFETLQLVHPYGGAYPDAEQPSRIVQRISIFHKGVRYPKRNTPLKALPDDLLDYFFAVFEQSRRGVPPLALLQHLQWRTCPTCKLVYARAACPVCMPQGIPAPVVTPHASRLEVITAVAGLLLAVTAQRGKLRWVAVDAQNDWQREDRLTILHADPDPRLRVRLLDGRTALGRDGKVMVLLQGVSSAQRLQQQIAVDTFTAATGRSAIPVFDATAERLFWMTAGVLYREGPTPTTPERIGTAVAGQTLFWTGPDFGFGFYRVGSLLRGFVFKTAPGSLLNDRVPLPSLPGVLLDVACTFGSDRCWFFLAMQEGAQVRHHCFVVRGDGSLAAAAAATRGDGSWLGTIGGACALSTSLLAPTDAGLVRLEATQGSVRAAQVYATVDPYVQAGTRLLAATDGIYLADQHTIRHLQLI